jgi:hypothetical protein
MNGQAVNSAGHGERGSNSELGIAQGNSVRINAN